MIQRRETKRGEVRWDARLYRPDGRQYSKTFRTRKEAEQFQATERADRARGTWIDPTAGQITFDEWAEEWFLSNRASWRPRTASAHRLALDRHWLPRLGHVRLSAITPRQLQQHINDLAQSYRPTSLRTYYSTLRSALKAAVDQDLIGRTPCRAIAMPSLATEPKSVVAPADLHALAEAVGPRWRCLIYLGGVMGLRFGEAAALRFGDLDLETGEVSIKRTLTDADGHLSFGPPKTAASIRRLSIPRPLVGELRAHVDRYGIDHPDELLFSDNGDGPLRRGNFSRRVFRPAVEGIGQPDLTFHGLRHSAATQWVADGVDARTVQHRLGHSDPRLVLKLYAHASADADRLAAATTAETFWPSEPCHSTSE